MAWRIHYMHGISRIDKSKIMDISNVYLYILFIGRRMKMEHVQRVQGDNVWDFEMVIGLKSYFLSTGLKQADDGTFISRKKKLSKSLRWWIASL